MNLFTRLAIYIPNGITQFHDLGKHASQSNLRIKCAQIVIFDCRLVGLKCLQLSGFGFTRQKADCKLFEWANACVILYKPTIFIHKFSYTKFPFTRCHAPQNLGI